MTSVIRGSLALVLAMAVVGLPVGIDLCAASCQTAHRTAKNSDPICHRSASSVPQVDTQPDPCGHRHGGTAMAADHAVLTTTASVFGPVASTSMPAPGIVGRAHAIDTSGRTVTSPPQSFFAPLRI